MLVIGNGESRQSINIDLSNEIKIGCNGILRDYRVRHLICVDRKMVNEALSAEYNKDSFIYTRKDWFATYAENKNLRMVPELPYAGSERADDPFNWGSGPYAVLQGAELARNHKTDKIIKMIGFDLYGTKENLINNVYKDTENYELSIRKPVDPKYWIYQISKVFEEFTDLQFVVYTKDNWTIPKSWKKRHVQFDKIDNFVYNSNKV